MSNSPAGANNDRSDDRIVVYQKPTCTTCRQVHAALKARGVDFDLVDYYVEPLSRATLVTLLRKMGLSPRDLLRTREPLYATLGLADPARSDDEILDAMAAHPDLIQRPIIEKGDRAILARPADRVNDLF